MEKLFVAMALIALAASAALGACLVEDVDPARAER